MHVFLKNWLPVFLWAGLIYFFSSQPDLRSGLPTFWDLILRKIIHIIEYAVLCLLIFRAFNNYRISWRRALILAGLFSILYAVSDEYHQTFIFGRSGAWRDVAIDAFGVTLVSWRLFILNLKTAD